MAAIANWLTEDAARFGDNVAMEVATAILLLQNAQESFKRLGTDFAQQVDHSWWLAPGACIAGKPAADEAVPLLDEMTRGHRKTADQPGPVKSRTTWPKSSRRWMPSSATRRPNTT